MTKLHTKLLVFFSVLVCSLCLCLGLAACNSDNGSNTGDTGGGEHTHTFGGFWLFDGAEGHYQLATCHTEMKSELEPHVDENADLKCDICGYVMHVHVDEDGDNFCDECQTEIHKHSFADEWTFNEVKHWHKAICEHFIERSDYVNHSFSEGVCECGVTESQVKVYNLYKNSPEYNLYFTQWLAWLKANGITSVEYTESGDGIYHYEDGTSEVHFLGERTVKVKAESGGEPLSDVWFMVTLYTNNEYYQNNGTMALGIAKTDESGIAEISFSPVGGYSSGTVQYRIRVALAADVAIALGTKEEDAKPIPNRYVASNASYYPYEVNENSNAEDIAATVNFIFSKGWNAYEQFTLPYARYYEKPYEGEGLKETGRTYEFTTTGENLFDYFYFTPSNRYSFASADGSFTPAQLAVIVENFQKAASGIYKIHFTVKGNANATLYYWNEQGVNLGAYHQTKTDGTPSDDYITSISGGTAGDGKYTGGNFVNVTVTPTNGLREFQFGIKSDATVKVTITVERVGDYVIEENGSITVGDNNSITLLGNGEITTLELQNVPAGYYYLTINTPDEIKKGSGLFSAYVDPNCVSSLWDGISQFKGIIEIPTGTPFLYVCNYYSAEGEEFITVSVNLSVYVPPAVKLGEEISVPISGDKDIKHEIFLDESVTSGKYYFELTLPGGQALSGASWYVRVLVGDNDYSFSLPVSTNPSETISDYIDINKGDKLSIFILGGGKYSSAILSGKLKLTASGWTSVQLDVVANANFDIDGAGTLYDEKYFIFAAPKSGTFKISLTLINAEEVNRLDLYYMQVENATNGDIIVDRGTSASQTGIPNTQASGIFELQGGETIILKFHRLFPGALLNINFIIEFVED